MNKHFLNLKEYGTTAVLDLVYGALELKKGSHQKNLNGKYLALIFEKSSTRTRLSFEVAMNQLGGRASFLSVRDLQLGRGEPISDTARVISSMADGVVLRTLKHSTLKAFAESSTSPIINGLTNLSHPCQLLADLQTFFEHRGNIQKARAAFVGDGSSNVCQSWINAAAMMDFELRVGAPEGYHPKRALVETAGNRCKVTTSAQEAVSDVDLVITDTWTGMGQENEKTQRLDALSDFQVNQQLMALASKEALFMHCLPAYRGQEVSAEVLEGPQSVVWDEAENRLHAQKALMELLMT